MTTLASVIAAKYPSYIAAGHAGPRYKQGQTFIARNDERGPVDERPRWIGVGADGQPAIVFVKP